MIWRSRYIFMRLDRDGSALIGIKKIVRIPKKKNLIKKLIFIFCRMITKVKDLKKVQ